MAIQSSQVGNQDTQTHKDDRLLRVAEVKERTKIGKTKRNELIRKGLFPAPIKILNERQLPGRTSYWLSSDIDAWLTIQAEARRARLAEVAKNGLNGWINRTRQLEGDRDA